MLTKTKKTDRPTPRELSLAWATIERDYRADLDKIIAGIREEHPELARPLADLPELERDARIEEGYDVLIEAAHAYEEATAKRGRRALGAVVAMKHPRRFFDGSEYEISEPESDDEWLPSLVGEGIYKDLCAEFEATWQVDAAGRPLAATATATATGKAV